MRHKRPKRLIRRLKMKQFKVKRRHLKGEIADFPRRVVQAMVDEQVRQGNLADPSVFWIKRTAGKSQGGFDWYESLLGRDAWVGTITWKKFYLIPKREKPHDLCGTKAEAVEDYFIDFDF